MGFAVAEEETIMDQRKIEAGGSKSYGNKLGYSIFRFVLKNFGLKWAYGILLLIIPYYVILRPSVYRRAKPYLQRRFPDDSFSRRYLRLFKYVYIFGQYLIDQLYFGFVGESQIKLNFEREAEILALLEQKPVIFLMSHVGYWEVAMAGSARFNKQLNVLVNRTFDKDKRKSFYDIRENRINLISIVDQYGGMIEATNALLRGEAVGVAGDRAEQWRSQQVAFLGAPAQFPVIAQQLAVATGATIIALFTSKGAMGTVDLHWRDISTEVLSVPNLSKEAKIQRMLETYSEALETYLRDHPYIWFNFFDFWKENENRP
jgi:predicted LPLAT superfamily acyltransferase